MKGDENFMKMKTLIVPVVATMLAVSCGENPAPGKDWSSAVKEFMNQEIGEVLPYLDLDEESLHLSYESDEFGGAFYAYDDNDKNLVEEYAEKLVSQAHFEYSAEEDLYYKETSKAYVALSLTYYDASSGVVPGNEINFNYLYSEEPTGDWDPDFAAEWAAVFGETLPFAFLDKASLDVYVEMESTLYGSAIVYDDNEENKLVSYEMRLYKAGFEARETSSGFQYFYKDLGKAEVFVLDWGWSEGDEEEAAGNYIYFEFSLKSAVTATFPKADIDAFFEECYEDVGEVPAFETAQEGVVYEYSEDWTFDYGCYLADVYAYGVTAAEVKAYVGELVEAGWQLAGYTDADEYVLQMFDTGASVIIVDWSDEEGTCFEITFTSSIVQYGISNQTTANMIAFNLGLPASEVMHSSDPTSTACAVMPVGIQAESLAEARSIIADAIPSYYYYAEDLSFVDPEGAEGEDIETYIDTYVVDGWVEGGFQVFFYVLYDEQDGYCAYIECSGELIIPEWTAETAMKAITDCFSYEDEETGEWVDVWDEVTDYSTEDCPDFYLFFNAWAESVIPMQYIKGYPEQIVVLAKLVGFESDGEWTAGTFVSGVPYEELVYTFEGVELIFTVYQMEYQSVVYNVLTIETIERPSNPEVVE